MGADEMTFDDAVKMARLVQLIQWEDSWDKQDHVDRLYETWPNIDWNTLIWFPCSECGTRSVLLDHEDGLCADCWEKQPKLEPGQLAKVNEILKDVFQNVVMDELNQPHFLLKELKQR